MNDNSTSFCFIKIIILQQSNTRKSHLSRKYQMTDIKIWTENILIFHQLLHIASYCTTILLVLDTLGLFMCVSQLHSSAFCLPLSCLIIMSYHNMCRNTPIQEQVCQVEVVCCFPVPICNVTQSNLFASLLDPISESGIQNVGN